VIAVVGVVSLGVASVVGVCLLLMLKSQERVCLPYRPSVVMRLVLCTVSVLMAVVATALASIRPDERLPYSLLNGWTFYVHILVIVVEVLLTLCCVYDFVLSRRLGGDPTFYSRDPSGSNALTYSNPSFTSDDQTSSRVRNSNSSLSSTASSVRAIPNGSSSNGSRLQQHKSLSGRMSPHKSPSGRTSPHRIRPGSGRLANGSSKGGRSSSGRGSRGSHYGSSKHRPSVAVTPSSGNPYSSSSAGGLVGGGACVTTDSVDQGSTSSILNGSFGSIESSYATSSSIISGSSVSSNPMALSPRKSSLKKRRTDVPPSPMTGSVASGDGVLGFQNPGFSEPRIGSIKRVRIASQSTDV